MKLVNQFPRKMSIATQSTNGLMVASDKEKIDNLYVLSYESTEPSNNNKKQAWIGDE